MYISVLVTDERVDTFTQAVKLAVAPLLLYFSISWGILVTSSAAVKRMSSPSSWAWVPRALSEVTLIITAKSVRVAVTLAALMVIFLRYCQLKLYQPGFAIAIFGPIMLEIKAIIKSNGPSRRLVL